MGQNDTLTSQDSPDNLDQYPLEVLEKVLQILKGRTSRGGISTPTKDGNRQPSGGVEKGRNSGGVK